MNRKLIPHASALFSATLLLGGCTMIPEYERPALPVADSFREAADAGATAPTAPAETESVPAALPAVRDVPWQEFFTEECLYRILPRESYLNGWPAGLMHCEGRGMLRDRILSLRRANIYEPHWYRHLVSSCLLYTSPSPRD